MSSFFTILFNRFHIGHKASLQHFGCKISDQYEKDKDEWQFYFNDYDLIVPQNLSDGLYNKLYTMIERDQILIAGFKFPTPLKDIHTNKILRLFSVAGSLHRKENFRGQISPRLTIHFGYSPSKASLEQFVYSPLVEKIEIKASSTQVPFLCIYIPFFKQLRKTNL